MEVPAGDGMIGSGGLSARSVRQRSGDPEEGGGATRRPAGPDGGAAEASSAAIVTSPMPLAPFMPAPPPFGRSVPPARPARKRQGSARPISRA